MKFRTWAALIAIIVLPLEGALLARNWRIHSCPSGEAFRIPMPFEHSNGHAWYSEIPELERLADNIVAYNSPIVICENDRLLGPAHSYHHEIAKDGQGRFSHWGTALVFSTSDNSNPNANGRSYLAIRTKSDVSPTPPANERSSPPASEPTTRPAGQPAAPPASEPATPPTVLTSPQLIAGEIVTLDKANQQISFRREELGQTSGAVEQFLLSHERAYDILKVGDRIALTIEYHDGVWKVTSYRRSGEGPPR